MNIVHDSFDRQPTDQIAPVPWKQLRSELESMYQPPMVAPATAKAMIRTLKDLDALGIESTADLTIPLLARMVASRPAGQSDYTLYGTLARVRTVCVYAETAGYLRVNPFRLRKLSKWVRLPMLDGKRHLAREEIRAILALMQKHVDERSGWAQWRARRLQAATAIIAYTGMRKMECLQLHVADVDLAAHVVWVRPHGKRLKTRASEAPLPIAPSLVPILESWIAHRLDSPYGFPLDRKCPYLIPTLSRKAPWTGGSKGSKPLDRFQAVSAQAGVKEVSFQMLRRSWATHAEPLMGEGMLSRILRHTTTRTGKAFYRQADIANMNQAVQNFEF